MPDLIRLDAVTAARPGGAAAFRDLSWALRDGETWAVVGPVGAGKTTFAELLLGRLPVRSGRISWPLVERAGAAVPADVIRLVAFREESRLFRPAGHYYQERFNFSDPLDEVTVDTFLRSGAAADDGEVRRVADRLGVGALLGASFITLSNGQARRARIARALLAGPELLVLDDPFLGLDAAGRADVARLLGEVVAGGTRVLLVCRPAEVPGWVTHVLELGGNPSQYPFSRDAERSAGAMRLDDVADRPLSPPALRSASRLNSSSVIELHDVTVRYGDRTVLDCVSWAVHRGERWALLGPNGSGKTTLLSLVCGDHPQAYANDVRVFGRRRGTGESIWDVKRRVGLVSPELHTYFSEPLTASRAAATGFFDAMTARPTTPDQDAAVRRLFAEFGLTDVMDRSFARLSTGQQRLVLLVRAVVKDPELLVLDEPFQGLDAAAVGHAKGWLDARLRADQTLIVVTHQPDELPRSVDRVLRLDGGRVVG